jgi:hypothetical protein
LRDVPPFSIGEFAIRADRVTLLGTRELPKNARYSNLTRCSDGTIYATSMAGEGSTELVQIDLQEDRINQLQVLAFSGNALDRDVRSLVCGPDGTLYVLADPQQTGTNSIFRIGGDGGELIDLGRFDADRMVFAD